MVAASDAAFAPVLALVFLSGAWAGRSGCRDEPIPAAASLHCNGTLTWAHACSTGLEIIDRPLTLTWLTLLLSRLSRNSKDNRPAPTIVVLYDYCDTSYISWETPRRSQLLQFSRDDKQPFVVCLNISRPGVAVYQLVGRSRRLLASSETSADEVPCQHSHCGNLPLLLESDEKVLQQNNTLSVAGESESNNSSIVQVTYQHFNDCSKLKKHDMKKLVLMNVVYNAFCAFLFLSLKKGCPRCTDTCMKDTICTSDYGECWGMTTRKKNFKWSIGTPRLLC